MSVKVKVSRSVTAAFAGACTIGLLLSVYAYHVETSHELDPSYRAHCDISEKISCTKVFSSRYGRGFGLMPSDSFLNQPNSVYGVMIYLVHSALALNTTELAIKMALGLAIFAILGSVYLGAILIFVLQDFCVVCVSMYVVNIAIFVCCMIRYREIKGKVQQKSQRELKKTR